jgi:hypothetical protein
LAKGANPRFVVTSLLPPRGAARELYEDLYGAGHPAFEEWARQYATATEMERA